MDSGNDAIKVLTSVIKSACERIVAKASYDRTVRGVVTEVSSNSSHVTVKVNGGEYDVPNYTGRNLTVGKSVWVLIPCNNYDNMFVIATR